LTQRPSTSTDEPPAGPPARREPDDDGSEGFAETVSWWWSAPLPPPQQLQQYDRVLPGLAERIVALTEREAAHRHGLDRSFVLYRFFGQWASVIIALAAIGAGTYLAASGHSTAGLATIITAVAALVAVFLVRQFFGNGNAPES
jgi:uncharacterized membrane protein